jgi:membrane protein DedA with SNARE-associated domain
MESLFTWVSQYGYIGLFALLLLGIAGLPVPDETLLVFSGYLIWRGRLHPQTTFLAALGGSACGITTSYLLGRYLGRPVITRWGRYIGLTDKRFERVNLLFLRIGPWLLTVGYFILGVRHFTALIAGTAKLRFLRFALFAYSGAAVWVALFLTLGYIVGEQWKHTSLVVERGILAVSILLAIVALAFFWKRRRKRRKDLARDFANIS